MAGRSSDFFVSFGSDASSFSRQLKTDLAVARQEIQTFRQFLEGLDRHSAEVLGRVTARVQKATQPTQAPTPAAGGDVSGIATGVGELARSLAAYDSELGRIMGHLGQVVDRIGRVGAELQAERTRQKKSEAGQAQGGYRDPRTGRFTTPENPQAVPRAQSNITRTPTALISEASFNRVVQSVERNVTATRAVEAAINRLATRRPVRTTGRPQQQQTETAVDEPVVQAQATARNARRRRIAQANRAAQEEVAAAQEETKSAQATRTARKARLTAQQRADAARDIALPADPAEFKSAVASRRITKSDLQRIATTFTQQGYQTPFNTKTSNEQLVSRILASRQEYERLGGATRDDLTTSGKVVATEVGKGVRAMVRQIVAAARRSAEEELAFGTVATDLRSGGVLTSGQNVREPRKTRGIRVPEGRPVQSSRGAFGGVEGEAQIRAAEEAIRGLFDRVSGAAVRESLRLATRPGFDPYSPEVRGSIKGRGEEAISARKALGRLSEATTAVDAFVGEILKVDKDLAAAQKAVAAMSRQADRFAKSTSLTAQETDAYTRLLADLKKQEAKVARLQQERVTLTGGADVSALLTPQALAGRQRRASSRAALEEQLRQLDVVGRSRQLTASVTRGGAIEALVGAQTGLRSGRLRTAFTRLLPGLAPERGLGNVAPTSESGLTKAEIAPIRKAVSAYVKAFRELAQLKEDPEADAKKVEQAKLEADRRLSRIFDAYDKVFKTTLPTSSKTVGGEELRFYSRAQQQAAVESDAKQQRRIAAANARRVRQSIEQGGNLASLDRLFAGGAQGDPAEVAVQRIMGAIRARYRKSDISLPGFSLPGAALERLQQYGVRPEENPSLAGAQGVRALMQELLRLMSSGALKLSTYPGAGGTAEVKPLGTYPLQPTRTVPVAETAAAATAGDAGGGGRPPRTTVAGAEPPSRGGGDGFDRIVKVLEQIHATLKGGLKVVPARPAGQTQQRVGQPTPGQQAALAANTPAAQARTPRQAALSSSVQGRQTFLAALPEDLRNQLVAASTAEERLAAAATLVSRGFADQRLAVAYFRGELKLSQREAAQFSRQLRQLVGDQRLVAAASRGSEQDAARASRDQERARQRARQRQAATARTESTARDQARTEERVNAALWNVGPDVEAAVAALHQLTRAGADNIRISEAQVRVYALLDRALREQNVSYAQRRQILKDVLTVAGPRVNTAELNGIARSAQAQTGTQVETGAATAGGRRIGQAMGGAAQSEFARLFFGNTSFWTRIAHTTGTFVVRNFAAGLVFGMTNALQDAIQQGIETESTFIRVSEALNQTGRSSDGLRTKLQGLSQAYGVALKDVYTTAAGLTGLFDNTDIGNAQLIQLTEVAVQLELISGGALNATEAMKSLASVTASYGEESSTHIADVATVIQNRLGVNIEDTIEGVARLSGQAKQLGISFESAATYVAAISKATGQTGAGAGEQFSRILASLQTGKTQSVVAQALRSLQIDITPAFAKGDYQQAIDTLLASYSKLSKAQQDQVATAIGGQRQAASINALFIQGSKVLDTTAAATNSEGAAQERARKISQQLGAEIKRTQAAFVNFFAVLVRSGALNAFGAAMHVLLLTLTAVNTGLSKMNDLAESNPLTKMLRDWGLGFVGLAVAISLGSKALKGLMATAAEARAAVGVLTGTAAGGGAVAETVSGARGGTPLGAVLGYGPGLGYRDATARYGPVDASGRPVRRASRPYAAASRAADAVSARADVLSQRLTTQVGEDATRAERALAAGRNVGAAAARGAARATNAISNSFAAMSRNALRANLSLAALTVGIAVVSEGASSFAQATKDYRQAYEETFGSKPKPTTAVSSQAEQTSRFDQLVQQNLDAQKGFTGYSRTAASLVDPRNYARTLKYAYQGKDVTAGRGYDVLSRNVGVVPKDEVNKIIQLGQSTSKRLDDAGNDSIKINDAITENQKVIKEAIDRINSSDYSTAQKQFAISEILRIQASIEGKGQQLKLAADGINSLNTLAVDQVDAIGGMVQALIGFSGNVSAKYQTTLAQYVNEAGFLPGSDFQKQFGILTGNQGSVYNQQVPQAAQVPPDINQRRQAGIQILQAAIQSATAEAATLPEGDERRKQLIERSIQLTQQLDQLMSAALQQEAADAAAFAAHLRYVGDFAGAAAALEKSLAVLKQQLDAGEISKEQYQAEVDQLKQQAAEDKAKEASKASEAAKLGTTNAQRLAELEVQSAAAELKALEESGASYDQILQAKQRLKAATDALGDLYSQQGIAALQTQKARIGPADAVARAQMEIKIARAEQAAAAKYGTNSVQYQQATQHLIQAQQELMRAQSEVSVANANLAAAIASARGDAVVAAQASLRAAQLALSEARKESGGRTTAAVLNAKAQVVAAQQAVTDAINAVTKANSDLSIAIAEAQGDTVKAADLSLAQAQRQLQQAKTKSGGKRTAEVIQAETDLVRAQAARRDAVLQDQLDTIDFNLQMGKISGSAAAAALQELLKAKDLTEKERRDILLKIKGLNDQVQGQWNIGDIGIPTIYETRRYQAVNGSGGGFARPISQQITNNNISIDGTDTAMVTRVLTQILGPARMGQAAASTSRKV